jgi:hypothetical protein
MDWCPFRFAELQQRVHSLALDGVFNTRINVFHEAPPVTDADVKQIVETIARRVIRLLRKRSVLNENDYDDFSESQPVLSAYLRCGIDDPRGINLSGHEVTG